jgi:phosphatidylglycerophosphate synthase
MKTDTIRERALENAKTIADVLTVTRLFMGFLIVICAFFGEKSLLPLVVALTLIGWSTDVADGRVARLDPHKRRTFIGAMDFAIDLTLIYSGLLYFIAAGFVPFWPFLFYALYAASVGLIWTKKSVMMAVAAPIVAMPLIFSFVYDPLWGWVFLGWIVLAMIVNWNRFREEIREFIEGVEKPD